MIPTAQETIIGGSECEKLGVEQSVSLVKKVPCVSRNAALRVATAYGFYRGPFILGFFLRTGHRQLECIVGQVVGSY
uniref:AT30086p1 n=1 Tax=Drosophila melanogaster TaxID=7227 RepID=G7H817_DROME|nr:AT30086p1 [Drosophila melanogaster]